MVVRTTRPKGRCYGAPRGRASDTQGRSPHGLGLPTYCPPPHSRGTWAQGKRWGPRTTITPPHGDACSHLPQDPEPQDPDRDVPWRTDPPWAGDPPMCRLQGPGSKRSWRAETGPYRPDLFRLRTTNYPQPPAGVGTEGPWDLQAPYLNRGPLQAQGLQGGLGGGRGLGCRPAQLGNRLVDSGESGVASPSKVGATLLSPERL